jgi:hypothetical protein
MLRQTSVKTAILAARDSGMGLVWIILELKLLLHGHNFAVRANRN